MYDLDSRVKVAKVAGEINVECATFFYFHTMGTYQIEKQRRIAVAHNDMFCLYCSLSYLGHSSAGIV